MFDDCIIKTILSNAESCEEQDAESIYLLAKFILFILVIGISVKSHIGASLQKSMAICINLSKLWLNSRRNQPIFHICMKY